jgi:biotin transport system substrate-specific component
MSPLVLVERIKERYEGEIDIALQLFYILLFSFLTAIGALIRIPLPFTPVPLTMQTFFVFLSGAVLGARKGSMSQLLYVGAGISGLPVFSGLSGGLGIVSGPTGGYLLGFILAPIAIGWILRKFSSTIWVYLAISAGAFIIFFMGAAHLTVLYTGDFIRSIKIGVVPFVAGDLIKVAVAGSAVSLYKMKLRR